MDSLLPSIYVATLWTEYSCSRNVGSISPHGVRTMRYLLDPAAGPRYASKLSQGLFLSLKAREKAYFHPATKNSCTIPEHPSGCNKSMVKRDYENAFLWKNCVWPWIPIHKFNHQIRKQTDLFQKKLLKQTKTPESHKEHRKLPYVLPGSWSLSIHPNIIYSDQQKLSKKLESYLFPSTSIAGPFWLRIGQL